MATYFYFRPCRIGFLNAFSVVCSFFRNFESHYISCQRHHDSYYEESLVVGLYCVIHTRGSEQIEPVSPGWEGWDETIQIRMLSLRHQFSLSSRLGSFRGLPPSSFALFCSNSWSLAFGWMLFCSKALSFPAEYLLESLVSQTLIFPPASLRKRLNVPFKLPKWTATFFLILEHTRINAARRSCRSAAVSSSIGSLFDPRVEGHLWLCLRNIPLLPFRYYLFSY